MVCFRYVIVNSLHKAGNKDNNNNNNNNILLLLLCCCLLSQAFSSWYVSSWTNDDPHHSGFKFQTAVLSVLCVMFQVVFCSESIECFPGTASKFFFKRFVPVPVARIFTGTIIHYTLHIRCTSVHKLLYFNLFSFSFGMTFLSACIALSVSVHIFSFLFLIIISVLFAVNSLSVCTSCFHL